VAFLYFESLLGLSMTSLSSVDSSSETVDRLSATQMSATETWLLLYATAIATAVNFFEIFQR
jgi:hypothetical protein